MELNYANTTLTAFLDGEIDHHRAQTARERIDAAIESGNVHRLQLDFSGVTFMDSSGIGLILGRYRRMENLGGELELVQVPPRIEKMIRMAGVQCLNIPLNRKETEESTHETAG